MSTLAEIASLIDSNTDLRHRFLGALVKASWDVINESDTVENHANRIAFAEKVMLDPKTYVEKYFNYYLSNAVIQSSGEASSDNDIQFVVNSFYDKVANLEAI